jgi:uncharacterized protein
MSNQIVWCDIPAKDLDRAIRFYSAVLGQLIEKEDFSGFSIGVFPHAGEAVSACLCVGENHPTGVAGPLIYLNCAGRLDDAVAAVAANGGKVLQPQHQIGPFGYRAVILDSEGNRVALHSP